MRVQLAGGCQVSHMHDGTPVVAGTLRIWNQVGRATGAQAISLRVMEFAPGMSPAIRNDDCDQILYVLDHDRVAVGDSSQGQAQSAPPLDQDSIDRPHPEGVRSGKGIATIFINGDRYEIGPDTGIYIRPNETLAIDNTGSDVITIISSQCPDPDRSPQFASPLPAASQSNASAPAPIVRLADQRAQSTADRWYRVMVDDGTGSAATQFVGSIPPGRAPDHFHNYEEVLFILRGRGGMWAGETNTAIAAGSCIYLPKGQVHCVENTGEGELRLLGVFYPAGSPSVRYEV
ncbi:MAG TPA: cupin domain-containing protein [Pyrinomonadaceae bacterium]|nr:cupin domain-containing protein [Pyrinomonadaceae bacterium]